MNKTNVIRGYKNSIKEANTDHLQNDQTAIINKGYIINELNEDGLLNNNDKQSLIKLFIF